MKITTFILLACFMQVTAKVTAQISISERNVPISSVLARIQQQSGYNLFYEDTKIKDVKINVNFNNLPLIEALERVLKNQALAYELVDKTIVIKTKEPSFLEKVVAPFTPPINVSGVVLDEKGMPLAGATVKVKGLKQSAVTDKDGKFHLPGVDEKAVLVVSYVGYADKEVSAKAEVSVSLELKSDELQEVVVAYGKQEQRAITGSVTVVKGEQIESLPNRSFDKSLQGLVPGLLVTQGSGQPGSGLSNFVLRGIATAVDPVNGLTSRNPLIVIDGVPVSQDLSQIYTREFTTPINNPLAQINPADIESMSVLKDASAIALYGSKASNGVILITTKRGKSGKTQFNFSSQLDIANRLKGKVELLNQSEYLGLLYETYRNTPNDPAWTDDRITAELKQRFPTRADGSFYPEADWYGALYSDKAFTSTNNLGISGGKDNSSYYMNLEYTKQNGIVKKTGYDRKSARLNFESSPVSWLKFGMNNFLSYNLQEYGSALRGIEDAASIAQMSPLVPIRLENGSYYMNYNFGGVTTPQANPAAMAEYNTSGNTAFRGMGKLYAELILPKGLKLRSTWGFRP